MLRSPATMSLGLHLPTALTFLTLAIGALGAVIFYNRTPEPPAPDGRKPSELAQKGKLFLEAWRAGPWAVRPQDMNGTPVVADLRIHPLKSCRDIAVRELRYGPEGIEYDRKWCIIDERSHKILTIRELPRMVQIVPELDRAAGVMRVSFPSQPEIEPFEVALDPSASEMAQWPVIKDVNHWFFPDIHVYVVPVGADALSRFLGQPVLLVTKTPKPRKALKSGLEPAFDREYGLQDECAMHIVSKESVREMTRLIRSAIGTKGIGEEWSERELDWRRYRANIVVEGAGVPFAEDAWRRLTIGWSDETQAVPSITSVGRKFRCTIPNTDQNTGEVDHAPLKVLLSKRNNVALEGNIKAKGCIGINCWPDGNGVIRVGDVVRVQEWLTK